MELLSFVVWLRSSLYLPLDLIFLFSEFLKPIFLLPFQFGMDHLFSGLFEAEKIQSLCWKKSNIERRIKNNNKKRDNKNLYIIAAHHNAAASELCKCALQQYCICVFRVCDLNQISSPFNLESNMKHP